MPHQPRKEEKKCEVSGCSETAVRSLSTNKITESGSLKIGAEKKGEHSRSSRGRTHVCKEHYRVFKKATKKQRELDRLGR